MYRPLSNLKLVKFLAVALVTTARVAAQNVSICGLVDAELPGRVSFPDSTDYDASQTEYYASQARELNPGCVFRPSDTNDVSQLVKLVGSRHQSRQRRSEAAPEFAVRAGGHTLWAGAANVDGGITVDMRSLNSVEIVDNGTMASLGGGAVYSEDVYGYEVVTASGDVVYATASSHRDLWLALKGGSNNFGIVTRLDVRAFPHDLMWGGVLAFNYTQDVLDAHAEAFSDFMRPENFDDAAMMSVILGFTNPGGVHSVSDSIFYGDAVEFPDVYDNFTSMQGLVSDESLGLNNVADIVDGFGEQLPPTVERVYQLVFSFRTAGPDLYRQLLRAWEDWTATVADVAGVNVQYLIQPHPVTNGTNSLGLTAGAKDEVMGSITVAYEDADDDEVVRERVDAFLEEQVEIVRREDLLLPFQYLNYADKSQDPIGSYGDVNLERLRNVSREYDPDGLFQRGISGAFRVFA